MGILSKKVGQRIKEIRESRGIKQCTLAVKLYMEPSNLTRIENGHQFPKEENLVKIADILGVEVKDLFDFTSDDSRHKKIENIISQVRSSNESQVDFLEKFVKLYTLNG